MDRDYIDSVRRAYEARFSTYTGAPLLTINTNDLNYVQDAGALAFVESQIRRALGIGAYQQSLPQMDRAQSGQRSTTISKPRTAHGASDGEILSRFLQANEVMGRVGAILANSVGGHQVVRRPDLGEALAEAMDHLRSLARSADVELAGDQR
jgi:hypothetical protein